MSSRSDQELALTAFVGAVRSSTGWYRAPCPFCAARIGKPDRHRSFSILEGEWVYHCFRCHVVGHLSSAPTGFEHVIARSQWDVTQETEKPADLGPPEGFCELSCEPGLTALSFAPARKYLSRRRVSKSICRAVGIGATLAGKAAHRIIVPIAGGDGVTWLGWSGRALGSGSNLKYLYPRGMQRGFLLFNGGAIHAKTDIPLIVVEGVFDALPHWPHAVACLGKPTRAQYEILCETTRPIVVALDGDAWEEGEALSMRLKLAGKRAAFVRLSPKTDPGNLSREDLNLLISGVIA